MRMKFDMSLAQAKKLLCLKDGFTEKEFRSNYRKLMLMCHPDRSGNINESERKILEEKSKRLNSAKEVIEAFLKGQYEDYKVNKNSSYYKQEENSSSAQEEQKRERERQNQQQKAREEQERQRSEKERQEQQQKAREEQERQNREREHQEQQRRAREEEQKRREYQEQQQRKAREEQEKQERERVYQEQQREKEYQEELRKVREQQEQLRKEIEKEKQQRKQEKKKVTMFAGIAAVLMIILIYKLNNQASVNTQTLPKNSQVAVNKSQSNAKSNDASKAQVENVDASKSSQNEKAAEEKPLQSKDAAAEIKSQPSVKIVESNNNINQSAEIAKPIQTETNTQPKPAIENNITSITIGSTSEEVKKVMGTPSKIDNYSKWWYYEYSIIEFDSSWKVKAWDDISGNLKVTLGEAQPNAPFITLGSSKQDVIRAMGTPTQIDDYSRWRYYKYSIIEFDSTWKVESWSNISGNLKVR